jgi:hypothetical protein
MPAPPGNEAYTHRLKLQHPQNKVLHTTGNFPRHMPVCNLHVAFKILYVYDTVTILCRQQAEVMQNHEVKANRNTGNIKGLNLAAVKPTTAQVTKLPF